jgi:ParB family transcriptional regulator, chromosome partitioning protein
MTGKSRGGLGRGLAALIPSGPDTNRVSDVLINGAPQQRRESPPLSLVGSETPNAATAEQVDDVETLDLVVNGQSSAELVDASSKGGASRLANAEPGPRYVDIPIDAIQRNPRNPRTVFDEDALVELTHSIREFGLLQPIVVRDVPGGGYELVMGERRWRAAQRAGCATIPAIVRRTQDADLLRDALLENIHRANLNPLEEAAAYQQLLEEFDVTQEELASRLGRSRPVISNTIRLLRLPVPVQRRVAAGVLSAGHARALLSLPDAEDQEQLAARIVAEGLSVRGAEEAVTMLAGRGTPRRRTTQAKRVIPGLEDLAVTLSDTFDTRVRLELGRTKGRIVVEFATQEDLKRIMTIMAPHAIGSTIITGENEYQETASDDQLVQVEMSR